MARLTRKNLMVDDEKVKELARRRGTSESEAVRVAIERELAAEELMTAMRQLQESGGVRDVFNKVPARLKRSWRAPRSRIRRSSS